MPSPGRPSSVVPAGFVSAALAAALVEEDVCGLADAAGDDGHEFLVAWHDGLVAVLAQADRGGLGCGHGRSPR